MSFQKALETLVALWVGLLVGCGTTREQLATDQLLLSDAVDRCVANIDFSPLAGEVVYLDTQYIRSAKSPGLVNADYIISSLRQQMMLAGCQLQETRDEAEYIVEARVGTLGRDAHDVNYGVPPSNAVNAAATIVSNSPPLPVLPEISIAKKTDDSAAAKIAVFAYHRETKRSVWQSGLSIAKSSARNRWVLGAGPFQSGEIYKGTHFAGNKIDKKRIKSLITRDDERIPSKGEDNFRNPDVLDERLQAKLRERLDPNYDMDEFVETGENQATEATTTLEQNQVQPASHEQVDPVKKAGSK